MSRAPSSARSLDDLAAQWVARQDAGLTEAEQQQLAAWLDAAPAHRAAHARYAALMSAVGRPKRTGAAAEIEIRLARLGQKRRRRRAAWSGATALIVLLAFGFFGWPRLMKEEAAPLATTALLLPRQQLLPDGTRVEYPAGTELSVDFTSQVRRVRLTRGEAVFSVAKNAEWPFVVEAGGVEFRAVGTAFAVNLRAEAADLVVTEGRVAVERAGAPVALHESGSDSPASHVVAAGNTVSVSLERALSAANIVSPVLPSQVAERLAWRQPRAEFSGAPLREVIDLLNRQNATKLALDDETLADVQLSGVFRTDDLDSLVHSLEMGFGIRAERGEREIRLRRAAQ